MRIRRRHALLIVTGLTALTVVPVAPAVATEVAAPETVTATLDRLPVDPAVAPGATAAATHDVTVAPPVETDVAFSTLGVRLPDGADRVEVRTRDLDGGWGEWLELERVSAELDGPDVGTPEAAAAADDVTEPGWVGPSDAFQLAVPNHAIAASPGSQAAVTEVADTFGVELIDTLGLNEGVVAKAVRHLTPRPVVAPAEASASRPNIVSRSGWGADERIRSKSPSYRTPTFAVLHHTAGSNTYTREQSAAVVRGIYNYHARTLGWGDIGYNVLVDRFGRAYEGRYGGLDRGVIGAHARGFNTGSFGVSVMGNYDTVDISSTALETVARVIAWKYDVHGIDRAAGRTMTANGKRINTLTAHRNVGSTACPGRYLYGRMGQLRNRVAALATGIRPPGVHVEASGPPSRFRDVPYSHPFHAPIEAIAARGVTEGCERGLYCPGGDVVRGQMASFLVRALELRTSDQRPFRDSLAGPHAPAIAALARSGVTTGCAPGRFCPTERVTRAQMASFLARAFEVPRAPHRFPDVGRRDVHGGAIGGLVEAGIANGYGDGTFRPTDPVTRAEMAAFLARALARSVATER